MLHAHHNFKHIDTSGHYFVTMISNSAMFESRYILYKRFAKQFPEGKLITCEVAFGTRPHEITERGNRHHLQFRTQDEIWIKENALNLAVQYLTNLDPDWAYVTIIDADVEFLYEHVEQKIVHSLQHFKVIQPWSTAVDFGPHDQPINIQRSFMYNWAHGIRESQPCEYYGGKSYIGHCGYVWSYRREAWNDLGGMFDLAMLGSGDHHMATALVGEVRNSVHADMHPNYLKLLRDYEERAVRLIDFNIGYIDGGISHFFHGKKAHRKYQTRWQILVANQFDPLVDVKRDTQGLYKLDCGWKLRNEIRNYFKVRNEDDKNI